jgi:hypothetical protein
MRYSPHNPARGQNISFGVGLSDPWFTPIAMADTHEAPRRHTRPGRAMDVKSAAFESVRSAVCIGGPVVELGTADYECGSAAASVSFLRGDRVGRWRARRQQLRPVSLNGEDQNSAKIDAFEAHRGYMVQDLRVNLSALRSPSVQGRLHLMGIPGHYQIRDQGERPRLREELFGSSTPTGASAVATDLPLQAVRALVMIERAQGLAPKILQRHALLTPRPTQRALELRPGRPEFREGEPQARQGFKQQVLAHPRVASPRRWAAAPAERPLALGARRSTCHAHPRPDCVISSTNGMCPPIRPARRPGRPRPLESEPRPRSGGRFHTGAPSTRRPLPLPLPVHRAPLIVRHQGVGIDASRLVTRHEHRSPFRHGVPPRTASSRPTCLAPCRGSVGAPVTVAECFPAARARSALSVRDARRVAEAHPGFPRVR